MKKAPRVVVITGASAGVGRATAWEFARKGATVALLARSETALDDTLGEVRRLGGSGLAIPCDVADAAAVMRAAERVERELGPIDVWVNNAMTTVFAPFDEIEPEEFERATAVTYLGFVNGTRAALRFMKPRNRGSIVQVGSALAYRSIPLQSPYCGAKHAIMGFTESLRTELMHDRSQVHLTMVQMPALNTPQFDWCLSRLPEHPQPVPPIYQPEVAARAIYWAATHRRREVRVGHTTYVAIWGEKIAPWFADRYLSKKGEQSQQARDMPVDPDRPANLFHTVEKGHAAHGSFDARAKTYSVTFRLATSLAPVVAAGGAAVALGLAYLIKNNVSQRSKALAPDTEQELREIAV